MLCIIKNEIIRFANQYEYLSVKKKLQTDPFYSGIQWAGNDAAGEISYKTEEVTPIDADQSKIKVLLLFKNPHPDSVKAGLFLSETYSKLFWNRLFEVDDNRKLLPLLDGQNWVENIAHTLLSGRYESPVLYYFKCLYSFPTKQFADLTRLFSQAPLTYRREILDKSPKDLAAYIKNNKIRHVIVFFKDAMGILGGKPFSASLDVGKAATEGIDQYLKYGDDVLFWKKNPDFKQEIGGVSLYLNMNTRKKNNGAHLAKRYFTHNLELILRDVLKRGQ